MAVLHSNPPARPGSTKGIHPCDGSAQCRGCQCSALSPQFLVALRSARRLAISAARSLVFSQAQLVLWGHPGVSSWLSHEGLIKFDWRFGHELGSLSAVLRQGG